eukprot:scaffold14119_cov428-Alexandrium_tamarense.AAC.15
MFALSSIISGMDVQLKTFFGDICPLNLPPLFVHMSHCKMITADVSASGVASKLETSDSFGSFKYVQDGAAIVMTKQAYRTFTHDECVRGGRNSNAKQMLDIKKYIADRREAGRIGNAKQMLDMKKCIADCKKGGKITSANKQAILKVLSSVERYCRYCG